MHGSAIINHNSGGSGGNGGNGGGASGTKALAVRSAIQLQDACATDSEAEDGGGGGGGGGGGRGMYSDQESNPDRENHPPSGGKAASSSAASSAARLAPNNAQPASSSGKPMRFKVVRYEEYRQKWGTKGRASVWDEHLPGVPTSLPPKTEMELRTEQNLLMCDPLPPTPIAYPHAQCHQQPQLSRRSHYERIPLAMLHYPKCDQARKPGAAGRLEVVAVRADDEPSPARGRRRHKASLPCPVLPPAGQLDGQSATATPPTEQLLFPSASDIAASGSAAASLAASNLAAAAATSDSSKVPSSSLATPPLPQSQQSSQPPSRQAPPPIQASATPPPHRTPPPSNLDLEAASAEDRSDEPPNPPNPPASPVPDSSASTATASSAAAAAAASSVVVVAAAPPATPTTSTSTAASSATATTVSTPRIGGAEICSVKRGRFTVASAAAPPSADDASVAGAGAVTAAVVVGSEQSGQQQQQQQQQSAAAVSAAGEVSQNAHDVAAMCQSYKPAMAHLFTPERVQAAFNWISHYRSEPETEEDSTFQVTIDNVAQTVVYLSSHDGKKKLKEPAIANAAVSTASGSAAVGGSPALGSVVTSGGSGGGGGSSSGSGNMTRSSSVETRLEARINGVTDMLQGAILSTVKSEMEPLQQLVQQLRTAVQQRDAEIQILNQTLRSLLSEEAMTAILSRQARLSRPE